MKKIALFLASGFGTGYAPVAPGTFGTVPGMALFILVAALAPEALFMEAHLLALGLLIGLGWWACEMGGRAWGHDDGKIVIDEMAGVYLTMLFVPQDWRWWVAAFLVFRISDIVKPQPAKWFDQQKGGFYTLVDDLVAGLYAGLFLLMIQMFMDGRLP